jgi:hypothetical protein
MNWTELLKNEIDDTFRATEGLIKLVDGKQLAWKPATGSNWMTTGQLLKHITTACGMCCRGFVTGDWGMPSTPSEETQPEAMLPKADDMPSVKSRDEALKLLAEDKALAHAMVKEAGEDALAKKKVGAPWDPTPKPLGRQLLHMVGHLGGHKGQLFYYLKLQGKPVHTGNLYGM